MGPASTEFLLPHHLGSILSELTTEEPSHCDESRAEQCQSGRLRDLNFASRYSAGSSVCLYIDTVGSTGMDLAAEPADRGHEEGPDDGFN